MNNPACQSLKQLSYTNRHGFFEIMSPEAHEIIGKIKPIEYPFPKVAPQGPTFGSKGSAQDITGFLEAVRAFLDQNMQEVNFSYSSFAYNLFTFTKTPKAIALDAITNLIAKTYSDISACVEVGEISLSFQPNGVHSYNFHRDNYDRESKAHIATIMFPLIGDGTIIVPYSQEALCDFASDANCAKAPENHAVTFISHGSQPTLHSAPQTDEPRLTVFFTRLDVTDFIQTNNLQSGFSDDSRDSFFYS